MWDFRLAYPQGNFYSCARRNECTITTIYVRVLCIAPSTTARARPLSASRRPYRRSGVVYSVSVRNYRRLSLPAMRRHPSDVFSDSPNICPSMSPGRARGGKNSRRQACLIPEVGIIEQSSTQCQKSSLIPIPITIE